MGLVQPGEAFECLGIIKINAKNMHVKINAFLEIALGVKFQVVLQTSKEVAGSL